MSPETAKQNPNQSVETETKAFPLNYKSKAVDGTKKFPKGSEKALKTGIRMIEHGVYFENVDVDGYTHLRQQLNTLSPSTLEAICKRGKELVSMRLDATNEEEFRKYFFTGVTYSIFAEQQLKLEEKEQKSKKMPIKPEEIRRTPHPKGGESGNIEPRLTPTPAHPPKPPRRPIIDCLPHLQDMIQERHEDIMKQTDRKQRNRKLMLFVANINEYITHSPNPRVSSVLLRYLSNVQQEILDTPAEQTKESLEDLIEEDDKFLDKREALSVSMSGNLAVYKKVLHPEVMDMLMKDAKPNEKQKCLLYEHEEEDGSISQWQIRIGLYTGQPEIIIRNSVDPLAMKSIPVDMFNKVCLEMGPDALYELVENTKKDRKTELARANEMKQYSLLDGLPNNAKVIHLTVFPKKYNRLVSTSVQRGMYMSAALQSKFGKNAIIRPVLFTSDLAKDLEQEMELIKQNVPGPKRIVIDLFSHGSPDGLEYGNAQSIGSTLENYVGDNTKCTLNTLACNGGGLIDNFNANVFRDNPLLEDHLDVFVQTKPEVLNRAAIEYDAKGNRPIGYSSRNYLELAKGILEDKTYGHAAFEADQKTKLHSTNDAEAIIRGRLFTNNDTIKSEELNT